MKMTAITHLHSTMYLLNPEKFPMLPLVSVFTFHYVSIKSLVQLLSLAILTDLHSTMYLLNLNPLTYRRRRLFIYIPLCIY